MTDYLIKNLSNEDFAAVIELGNKVHGDGYLDETSISKILDQSTVGSLNASYVMSHDQTLLGFRLSYAPNKWPLDKWCTSDKWPVNKEHVAYFKCNTIHPDYQGKGLGGQLLQTSITTLKEMGAKAGLSHIWMQSPGNASFKYFTKDRISARSMARVNRPPRQRLRKASYMGFLLGLYIPPNG